MTSTFLFLMMLMNGPVTGIDNLSNEFILSIKVEMRQFAKEMQINETNMYYDTMYPGSFDEDHFRNELIEYWGNYQLLKGTPRLEEYGGRFEYQNIQAIDMSLKFNREFEKFLEKKMVWELDRAPFYQIILDENTECRAIWNKISTLSYKEDYYGEGLKRKTYLELKKLINEKDWLNPDFVPPYVPEWRFYK